MSGLAGIINFDGRPVDPADIDRMTGAMKHRGPDGIFKHVDGSVGFGFCKLATTDEALRQDQPVIGGDGRFILVFDGWLENYDELLTDLAARGDVLRTRDDAEIVMRCFERWGEGMLERLYGDFGVAVWDRREERLFCARDRMGNRPFNFYRRGTSIYFATDIAAILELPDVPRDLDLGTVAEFVAARRCSIRHTFWKEIERLQPATIISADDGAFRQRLYWRPDDKAELRLSSEEAYAEHHLAVVTEAVRAASRTNSPFALEVSGGLDSSSVFAAAHHLAAAGSLLAPTMTSSTLVFPDDPVADESELTSEIAAFTGVPISRFSPTLMDYDWYVERARSGKEFPGFANGVMSWDMRRSAAEIGARVLATGMGGDEWFGDPDGRREYYRSDLRPRDLVNWWSWAKSDAKDFGFRRTLFWIATRGFLPRALVGPLRHVAGAVGVTSQVTDGARDLLTPSMREALDGRQAECASGKTGWEHGRWDYHRDPRLTWAVEAVDREASFVGLSLRHPLRSARVVEYSHMLPQRFLVRGRTNKYLHRRAFSGMLPPSVLARGNKAEFSNLVGKHLRNASESLPLDASKDWLVKDALAYLLGFRDQPPAGPALGRGTRLWALGGFVGCYALVAGCEEQVTR